MLDPKAIEIIFEDPQLLVVNKPAGLPVHETRDELRANIQGLLEKRFQQKLVLFHRLDLDTSGLLVFGKDPSINKAMTDLFRDRQVKKLYWAVVDGRWPEACREVQSYIDKVGGRWKNVPKGRGAPHAHTLFRVLESVGEKTWLEAELLTGRTHQIRLHCQLQEHPILGDGLYGRRDSKSVPMALHARTLAFLHPVTGKDLLLTASPPNYWKEYWLRGFSKIDGHFV